MWWANDQHDKVLNKLLGRFQRKLTREKWMKITKACSRTALRDFEQLIAVGVIEQDEAARRSASHRLERRSVKGHT
jgi:Fic family protein